MGREIEKITVPPDEGVRPPEARGIRTMFSDISGEVARRLTERYGSAVPPERLRKLHDLPAVYERRPEFDQSLKNAGGVPPRDGEVVLGFVRENSHESPHVALDQPIEEVIRGAIHEGAHQLAHPTAKQALGTALYEGTTELMTRDIVGPTSEATLQTGRSGGGVYESETALARNIEEVVGRDVVENAYLKGDMETLSAKVDEVLGKGSLEAFGAEVKGWEDLPRVEP